VRNPYPSLTRVRERVRERHAIKMKLTSVY
jgi:hypothetical protein